MKPKPNSAFDPSRASTFGIILLGVVCIWLYWSYCVHYNYVQEGEIDSGKLGDSYGVITSFFSALGVAGLIYTILLQRKELRETRAEFQKQTQMQTLQANEIAKQSNSLELQRLESTFFNLLGNHINRVNSPHYQESLSLHLDQLKETFSNFKAEPDDKVISEMQARYQRMFDGTPGLHATIISYINDFYTIVDFISRSFPNDKKAFYFQFLLSGNVINHNVVIFYSLVLEAPVVIRRFVELNRKERTPHQMRYIFIHPSHGEEFFFNRVYEQRSSFRF